MSTRVYVGGLNYRCREEDIERFFRRYGRIREISIKKGYAFVEFDDYRDADDACYECHGKDLMGERITIELAKGTPHGRDKERWGHEGGRRSRSRDRGRDDHRDRGRDRDGKKPVWMEKYGPPTRTDYRVIVENLSSTVSWQDLKDFMRQAGDVTYADAHKSKRNEGVVEFANSEDLKVALSKLDDTELNGRRIKLVDDSRGGGSKRGGSRSRTRSRSRSRSRRGRSRSGSRRQRSRSGSPKEKSASRSREKSRSPRSKSRSPKARSRSPKERSRSPKQGKSRSASPARSASRSP